MVYPMCHKRCEPWQPLPPLYMTSNASSPIYGLALVGLVLFAVQQHV